MSNENTFSIELANGKTMKFERAADMVAWLDQQRGLEYRPRRSSPSKRQRRSKRNPNRATIDNKRPLARYANRNSGEV